MSFRSLLRAVLLVLLFAVATCVAAMLSSWYVVHQLAATLRGAKPPVSGAAAPNQELAVELDFCQAIGITAAELADFLRDAAARERVDNYPVLLTLQNSQGDYLAGGRVIIRWDGGEKRLQVGESAVIRFLLDQQMLPGLSVIAPPEYTHVRQRSIPLGTAYEPEEEVDFSPLPYPVYRDGLLHAEVLRGLERLQAEGDVLTWEEFRRQLRQDQVTLELPLPTRDTLTAEEIYERRRDCVVVIAHRFPDGRTTQASGFVLDPSGVVVTNFHVVNKPSAVSRGVLTSDGTMHPITAVLAADRSSDLAVLQIQAEGLQAASLADGEPVGATVTIISHPNLRYYSLTRGAITRYWAATSYGQVRVWMGMTADFADGSSGAPCFNEHGNVVAVVSSTQEEGYQMVHRTAVPTEMIRRLIRDPAVQSEDQMP